MYFVQQTGTIANVISIIPLEVEYYFFIKRKGADTGISYNMGQYIAVCPWRTAWVVRDIGKVGRDGWPAALFMRDSAKSASAVGTKKKLENSLNTLDTRELMNKRKMHTSGV